MFKSIFQEPPKGAPEKHLADETLRVSSTSNFLRVLPLGAPEKHLSAKT
jgi:hypothetical protein